MILQTLAMRDDFITLSELQASLSDAIAEAFPSRVWVKAEVASVQAKAGGHCYLELCESIDGELVAKVRAVIWRSRYAALRQYFKDATGSDISVGMTLLLRAQVNYSELYGLSLDVDEIEPQETLGEAEMKRRQTIARLESEGLMDLQRELCLPALPRNLAVISARDAAGYGDFCRHLDGNEYGFTFRVTLFEAVMQGSDAPSSISDALMRADADESSFDAILILRGGGSNLDLACFDDYDLAVTIARCCTPVLTAIGHDRDRHVADMVANISVKTPTALADIFIDAFAAEDEQISSYSQRLRLAFNSKIAALESKLDLVESRIRLSDPRAVLARGYSLVTDAGGRVLKSAKGLGRGDALRVYFKDGKLEVEVKS